MRNSTLRAITASVTAVSLIVSLGTFPVLARGAAAMPAASESAAAVFTRAGFARAGIRMPTATTAVTMAVRQTRFLC
jgi:hypothetical protein